MAVVVKPIGKLTTCALCKRKFANSRELKPKFLDCCHCYCNNCVEDVERKSDEIECISCRKTTSLDCQLRNNHYALMLVELQKTLQAERDRHVHRTAELERENARLSLELSTKTAALKPTVLKYCHVTFHAPGLFDEEYYELTFVTAPEAAPKLAELFHSYCNEVSTVNFVGCNFHVAVQGMYVKFGKWEDPQDDLDPSLEDLPMIQKRGDVGLYCEDVNAAHVWDFVILLDDYRRNNLRQATLVAELVNGFDFCEDLSHLAVHERQLVTVSEVELCDA